MLDVSVNYDWRIKKMISLLKKKWYPWYSIYLMLYSFSSRHNLKMMIYVFRRGSRSGVICLAPADAAIHMYVVAVTSLSKSLRRPTQYCAHLHLRHTIHSAAWVAFPNFLSTRKLILLHVGGKMLNVHVKIYHAINLQGILYRIYYMVTK